MDQPLAYLVSFRRPEDQKWTRGLPTAELDDALCQFASLRQHGFHAKVEPYVFPVVRGSYVDHITTSEDR